MKHDNSGRILRSAAEIITAVSCRNEVLDELLETVDPEHRRTLAHLLLTFFRRKKQIDAQIDSVVSRPPLPMVKSLLEAALTQIFFQSALAVPSAVNIAVAEGIPYHADKFINAVLRKLSAEKPEFPNAPEAVFPEKILSRWRNRPDLTELASCFVQGADFTFRLERDYSLDGIDAQELPSPAFRFFKGNGTEVLKSSAFAAHHIYVQDPATSLALSLADCRGHRRILDGCGAPGGKALMLAEMLDKEAVLTVADRSGRRQELTKENFAVRGIPARIVTAELPELTGEFDLILLDVPCSNTGTFRRRPDALWHFSGKKLAELMKIQNQLLENGAAKTQPGGTLIYSTCSIEEEENSRRVEFFLKNHPEFTLKKSCQLLPAAEHDGAFAAVLEKRQ